MAQPKVEIDWKILDTLLQFKVTLKFCAEYLECSVDAIQRRIKEEKGKTFEEYHASKLGRTAVKLQQKAIEMALTGDRTMMIFCLKNLAGWADKVDHGVDDKAGECLKLAYSVRNNTSKV
jgi:hypothetical protein